MSKVTEGEMNDSNIIVMEHSNQIIDSLLQQYHTALGEDYVKYRNHVYRVFFNCLLIDSKRNNEDKYAIAAVFHDIGIWTKHTIDYLDPSIKEVRNYLERTDKQDWIDEIVLMIQWHHKITRYRGMHETITENFRKADWIDVSLGLINFGNDKGKLKNVRRQFANKGFHLFLLKKISKNFLHHPLNPLPMFRK